MHCQFVMRRLICRICSSDYGRQQIGVEEQYHYHSQNRQHNSCSLITAHGRSSMENVTYQRLSEPKGMQGGTISAMTSRSLETGVTSFHFIPLEPEDSLFPSPEPSVIISLNGSIFFSIVCALQSHLCRKSVTLEQHQRLLRLQVIEKCR